MRRTNSPTTDGSPAVSPAATALFLSRPKPAVESPQRLRVLVIEDNEESAAVLLFLLRAMGFEARAVHDATAAIEQARAFGPALIVSDLNLPDRDGFQLAAELQTDPQLRDVPLVALSGRSDPDSLARALDAGFSRYLEKPVLPEELRRTVSSVLANRAH
ncbi:MAG TPA: response regulator [Burkholderiaceae bacterium]|jgi:CheY-like chemotaxis protein|nr:response regulator [Burkholderiaceae bacterium]